MEVTAISWNLFHGRDFPPDPALRTWRSRLLRVTERNETHVQVNRNLLPEFCRLLAGAEWDVALLQECPPRWWEPLARRVRRRSARRSHLAQLAQRRAHARRPNQPRPDRLRRGRLEPHPGPKPSGVPFAPMGAKGTPEQPWSCEARAGDPHGRPERRAMAFTRFATSGEGAELCVANLHATNDRPELATEDVLRAAEAASDWAGDAPLIFGGDLNLRPAKDPAVFEELRERFGLAAPTAPDAIDHLLVRGLDTTEPPRQWPPERRELDEDGLALRLSDHTPVEARFALSSPR